MPGKLSAARMCCAVMLCVQGAILSPLLLNAAHAQSESGRASIAGSVSDGSGGMIPGATITARAEQTGLTRTLHSDGAGLYSFPSLAVGPYTLKATAPGFGDATIANINLSVGQSAAISIILKPGQVSTNIEVSAGETDITHRAEIDDATILDNNVVENLPTRGRNFTDFALLTPGISQEQDRFGLVVNGQRSGNSNISIDGVDFNDPLQNGQRGGSEAVYFFPQVAVREFQVVRTGVTAEVGRTNAGFVNVTTKSGTNRFHGEALYMNRNPWLTWPDALNDPEANNQENQYAFGIGGPILRDKLFFFAGIEKTEFHVPFFVRFNDSCPITGYYDPTGLPDTCTQATAAAGAKPLPANITALETDSYGLNNPLATSARLDWQVSPKNTAMLQYMSTFLSGLAFGNSGIQDAAASSNTTYAQQSQAIILGLTTALSSRRTNDLHLQWVYDHRQQVPNSPGAEIDISDLGTLGGNANGTYLYRAIREELNDNFSLLLGKHSLRFGVDINLEPETQQREPNPNGLWTVDTFADYLAALPGGGTTTTYTGCTSGCAYQFQQTVPLNGTAETKYVGTQREFAGYIQDMFHILHNVTLGLGFRYEVQLEPTPSTNPLFPASGANGTDVSMWQPRLGIAWDVHGNGTTVVRASSGLFDARTPGYLLARSFTDNGLLNANLDSDVDPTLLKGLTFPQSFPTLPAGTFKNDIYVTNPAFQNPRSFQAALTVEQQLTQRLVFVTAFTQQETWKLQHRLNTNLAPPTIDPTTLYPIFSSVRPNSTINGYHQDYSTAHSTYRSLIAQLKGRVTRNLSGTLNYTWAVSRDDDSNERDYNRELALDPLCPACYNKGYSKQDIRDQFNMHLVYKLPLRFTFSSSFLTRTPLPYTAVTSGSKQGDFNNDGNTDNDRPILCSQVAYTVCQVSATQINEYKGGAEVGTVVGRNTFRQNGFLNWDMRLIKAFRVVHTQELQFSAECLNCSGSSNLNLGANAVSKFTHAQATMNPLTGYYYSGDNAGKMIDAYDTFRSGGPRQIQLGARYTF